MATRKARSSKKQTKAQKPAAQRQSFQFDLMNSQLQWQAYLSIERQIDEAWKKLQGDIKRKANPRVILEDKNHLMLLLGECNYMARECMRWIDHVPQKSKRLL